MAHPETNSGDDGAVTPTRRRADGGGPKHRPGETDRPDGVTPHGDVTGGTERVHASVRDGPRVPEWRVLPDTERRVGAHRGRCLGRGPYWIDPDAGIRPVNARQRRPGGDPAGGRTRCRPGSRQSDDHSRSPCSYADPRESLSDIAIAILPDAGWLSPERRPPGGVPDSADDDVCPRETVVLRPDGHRPERDVCYRTSTSGALDLPGP